MYNTLGSVPLQLQLKNKHKCKFSKTICQYELNSIVKSMEMKKETFKKKIDVIIISYRKKIS